MSRPNALFRGRFGRVYPTDILFFLHIGWATLALGVNNPNAVVQNVGSNGVEFIGAYVLARAYIRSRETFTALCRALVIMVLLTVPFAVFETLTGKPVIIEMIKTVPGLTSFTNMDMDKRLGLDRVQAVFNHPIHYGLFCSVVFSLTFVALKGRISPVRRYVSSAVVVAAGFLALSSGAFLAILLQLGLIFWNTVFARVRIRWVLLVALFGLAYIAIDLLSNRTPIRVFMSYATFSAQTAYWRSLIFEYGTANVWASPVFGIGLNDWVRPYWMGTSSVDNFWHSGVRVHHPWLCRGGDRDHAAKIYRRCGSEPDSAGLGLHLPRAQLHAVHRAYLDLDLFLCFLHAGSRLLDDHGTAANGCGPPDRYAIPHW